MAEYIEREAVLALAEDYEEVIDDGADEIFFEYIPVDKVRSIPAADVRPVPKGGIGEMSDGHHTFNGLYYQRMMLFAALVRAYKDRAWKSYRHEDGELCFGKDDYFIVGIDTPEGSYTYHYHGEFWDLFDCVELPVAKHWDGHTEDDVTRLLSLPDVRPVVRGHWHGEGDGYADGELVYDMWQCSCCGEWFDEWDDKPTWNFCPNCGADMRGEQDV